MGFIRQINDFLRKDSGNNNESTKLRYVVRVTLLLFLVYIFAMIVVDYITFGTKSLAFYCIFFLIFLAAFVSSYYLNIKNFMIEFNILVLAWAFISVYMLGWNPEIQLTLIILLVLNFFTGYGNYLFKVCYAVFLCFCAIYLYLLSKNIVPFCPESSLEETVSELIDSIFSFFSIGFLCYVFSEESQNLEGKLIEYNNQLINQANTDPLTGLFNRRRTTKYLAEMAVDSSINSLSVCICDIDFFKKINDSYGHDIGDKVLKTISSTMKTILSEECLISRWGGEEFLIVFPNMNGDDSYVWLQKLRNAISKLSFDITDRSFGVSLTFGLSEYDFKSDVQTLIKDADDKLYMGKENGRNQIVF